MIYQHPLAYLLGLEGLALLRAWAGDYDYDERFVRARLAEVRRLLDDERLTGHPGVLVERGATAAAYRQWSATTSPTDCSISTSPCLVLLGSAVKAEGPDGRPQLAATHRHTVADFLRAALATGFSVRRFEERPRPTAPEGPAEQPTDEIGSWPDWPWTLLGLVPEAARAAWNNPAMTIWHFRLD